jgi:hypothetical protein
VENVGSNLDLETEYSVLVSWQEEMFAPPINIT